MDTWSGIAACVPTPTGDCERLQKYTALYSGSQEEISLYTWHTQYINDLV